MRDLLVALVRRIHDENALREICQTPRDAGPFGADGREVGKKLPKGRGSRIDDRLWRASSIGAGCGERAGEPSGEIQPLALRERPQQVACARECLLEICQSRLLL